MPTNYDSHVTIEMLRKVREMIPIVDPSHQTVIVMSHDEYGRVRRLVESDYGSHEDIVSIPVRVRSWAKRIYLLTKEEADYADVHFLRGGADDADQYASDAAVRIEEGESN